MNTQQNEHNPDELKSVMAVIQEAGNPPTPFAPTRDMANHYDEGTRTRDVDTFEVVSRGRHYVYATRELALGHLEYFACQSYLVACPDDQTYVIVDQPIPPGRSPRERFTAGDWFGR